MILTYLQETLQRYASSFQRFIQQTFRRKPASLSIAQAIVQSASRVEERTWERQLDAQLQKLLKTNHQESIDAALNGLFKDDLAAYDVLMDGVEAVSESSVMVEQATTAPR